MSSVASFYDLKAETPRGDQYDFATLKDKVVLIVNTASKCGFTKQYTGLQKLYDQYKDKGFEIVGFPCNQFGGQEPGTDDEVASFCQLNHGVSFPLMKKSDVNGDHTNEVFKYLKSHAKGILGTETKFIIDRNGKVVHRYSSTTTPESIASDVEKLLAGGSSVQGSPNPQ
ncbi:Glutathione peroxidase 2 [Microbotryomycetes sp. JL221]|nr:Glutathione peroxidase 2 [Microbotryomycetes sp. JL221]